jgi:hypothetical protein
VSIKVSAKPVYKVLVLNRKSEVIPLIGEGGGGDKAPGLETDLDPSRVS